MSADNWTICPKCKRDYDAKLEADKLAVGKSYGKVAPKENLEEYRRWQNEVVVPEILKIATPKQIENFVRYGQAKL